MLDASGKRRRNGSKVLCSKALAVARSIGSILREKRSRCRVGCVILPNTSRRTRGKDQTIIQRSGNIRSSSRCRSRVLHLVGSCICRFQVTSIGMYLSHLQSQSSPLTARQPTPTGVTSRRTFRVASFHHPFGPHSAACIWTVSDRCAACTCLTFPVSFQPLACSLAPKTPPSYAVIKPNPPNILPGIVAWQVPRCACVCPTTRGIEIWKDSATVPFTLSQAHLLGTCFCEKILRNLLASSSCTDP